ncbi:MAG: hypothetical protein QM489_05055 [Candidatus Izemoplasma sp.]
MKLFYNDLKKTPILTIGFLFLSLGMVLTLKSGLGMSPWGVFHTGLVEMTGMSLGVITQVFGLFVLLISMIFVKTKVGIGTILNIAIIGIFVDVFDEIITYVPSTSYLEYGLLLVGLVLMTFGRALYISAKLGAGPRDGLFVGLSSLFNIEVKYMKPLIELTVLIIGYFLGGEIGIGTVILGLSSGYFVQSFFKVLGYNPRIDKQGGIDDYIASYKSKKTSI